MSRAAIAALALLAGCAAAPPAARPTLDHALVAGILPADYPGADAILAGFDPAAAGAFTVGDAALFALEIRRGAQVERRLLRLRVRALTGHLRGRIDDGQEVEVTMRRSATITETAADGTETTRKLEVTPIAVELTQYDAAGTQVRTSEVELYEELLANGLRPMGERDTGKFGLGALFLHSLEQLGQKDPVLADQLFAVADRPSLLSVVWNLGLGITIRSGDLGPWRGPPVDAAAPDRNALPLDIAVNDTPVLYADLLVAPAEPPLAITGGLLAAVARHATDPQRHAVLRLLAARRGAR